MVMVISGHSTLKNTMGISSFFFITLGTFQRRALQTHLHPIKPTGLQIFIIGLTHDADYYNPFFFLLLLYSFQWPYYTVA